jgi:hypothetical protein|tara:strand:+ start:1443 stop:1601 length:159 start_codon:yes stop_codon:yes gene_type:complete
MVMDKKLKVVIVASVGIAAILIGVSLLFIQRGIDRKAITEEDRNVLSQITIS